MLSCPVCSTPLHLQGTQLVCEKQHSFDRARQGYHNLLLNQHKKSKQPGDNADMVVARTAFLDKGYYQSISDALNQYAVEQFWQSPKINVVDMGCGEGYYTQRLAEVLQDHQIQADVFGLDISKEAVKAAARRSKLHQSALNAEPNKQGIQWLVANGVKPPFEAQQSHLVLNIFNRIMPESLRHLCHPDGQVVIVSAGTYHLEQLKQALYETPKFEEFDSREALAEHFKHHHRTQLDFEVTLDQAAIAGLLHMTPHTWRSTPEAQAKLLAKNELKLRIHVNLDWFKPCSSSAGSDASPRTPTVA